MNIQKFTESVGSDKVFTVHGKQLYQRHITSFNSQGYKLYYYKDFQLIEITKIVQSRTNANPWKAEWGKIIFFLNNSEYEHANIVIAKSKGLYDKYMEQAENVAKLPLSTIYYDILKLG